MKTITKLLLMVAITVGVVSCSNEEVPQTPESLRGSTYASISVKLPKTLSTRALPGDYRPTGEWKGIDAIQTITVFLHNETLGTVDYATFGTGQFDAIDAAGVLKPNLAVKGTPGESVKAFVVINGNADILTTLKGTAPNQFTTAYATEVAKIASELSSNDGTNDVIMMTNDVVPVGVIVAPNVSEADAKAGSVNTVKVNVERVVSRALVTVNETAAMAIPVKNANGDDISTITIVDLKYVVGQSNNEFFLIKKANYVTPDNVYNHVPAGTPTTWNPALFDNSGLTKLAPVQNATGGTTLSQFEPALIAEKAVSKFVLPVTHLDANYKKGNTTYFEVQATFKPDLVDSAAYTPGDDVFLGMNDGLFYSSRVLAETSGQKATHYKGDGTTGAIMKYVLWLNPDVIPGTGGSTSKTKLSPTVRNQVYHAHIKKFSSIGVPNNPLNPNDPEIPGNPKNPIDPTDPLETEDTYLSVEITVLPWGIHSYEIDLGNDY